MAKRSRLLAKRAAFCALQAQKGSNQVVLDSPVPQVDGSVDGGDGSVDVGDGSVSCRIRLLRRRIRQNPYLGPPESVFPCIPCIPVYSRGFPCTRGRPAGRPAGRSAPITQTFQVTDIPGAQGAPGPGSYPTIAPDRPGAIWAPGQNDRRYGKATLKGWPRGPPAPPPRGRLSPEARSCAARGGGGVV